MQVLFTTAAVLLGLLCIAPRADSAELERIHTRVREEMNRQKIPGLGLLVVEKGKVILAQGYGLANVELDSPVTAQTMFQSGSIGKQFTAVAVMLQVEDGKLGLDDPVSKWIPGTPKDWKQMTIRHLLTHTSGIPEAEISHLDLQRNYTDAQLVEEALKLKLKFVPGTRWSYSNTGYDLLGTIIRKTSGKLYGDVLKERVFGPLGMKTARVISEEDIVMKRAAGYQWVKGELKNQEWVAPSHNTSAAGALYLSIEDYVAWDAGLRTRAILKPESWAEIYEPARVDYAERPPYGFGWEIMQHGGQRHYRHGGGWQGFATYILHSGPDDLTVVVLCNLAQARPEMIAQGIVGIVQTASAGR